MQEDKGGLTQDDSGRGNGDASHARLQFHDRETPTLGSAASAGTENTVRRHDRDRR